MFTKQYENKEKRANYYAVKRHLSLETTTFALPTQELGVHKAIRK